MRAVILQALQENAPGMLVVLAAVTTATALAWRASRWFQGRPRPVPWLRGLVSIPRRYLVDVHDVVVREPASARMHIFAAGGFMLTLALAAILFVARLHGHVVAWLLMGSAVLLLVGAVLDQVRRASQVSARLSSGAYELMPGALAAFALFYGTAALPYAGVVGPIDWLNPWAGLLLIAGFTATAFLLPGMAIGPMRHAFAGAAHLAFHPRPERFTREAPPAALQPIDLNAERPGVQESTDFFWNQILSFDACVQCGRCELACPAYAAGMPLNPKKLIVDLWTASAGPGSDARYAGHHHPSQEHRVASAAPGAPLVGDREIIHPDTIWACTTCRACVHACPMLIEHVDAVVDLRRFQTLELGATPGRAPDILENFAAADNSRGKNPAERIDWAADLNLPIAAGIARPFDILLWLGDSAFEARGQRTLRALIKVLRLAQLDFAVLGSEEADTGDLARRLGDEATFQALACRNITTLSRYRFKRILTADPHVLHVLKQEYPALGAHYEVVHHTTFLADLIDAGALELGALKGMDVTFHDPCYLGRYNGETEAPRRVLKQLGVNALEMERSGMRSFCCGGGGGAAITDVPGKRRIPDLRMDQARATGAKTVAVACPNCAVMLEGVSGPRPAVIDIAELVAQSLDAAPTATGPRHA